MSRRPVLAAVVVTLACGGAVLPQAHAALGDRPDASFVRAVQQTYQLRETSRRPLVTRQWVVTWEPHPFARARDHVEVLLTLDDGGKLAEVEVRLHRPFLHGRDAVAARDLLRKVLESSVRPVDLPMVQAVLNDAASAPQDERLADRSDAPSPLSAEALVLLGRRDVADWTLATTRVHLENVQRPTGRWLYVKVLDKPTLAAGERMPSGALPGSPSTLPGGPVLPAVPQPPADGSPPLLVAPKTLPGGEVLPVDPLRPAWMGLFLDARDLESLGMTRTWDTRLQGPEPGDQVFADLGGSHAGEQLWLGPGNGPVWRVVDQRWLLPDAASARKWLETAWPRLTMAVIPRPELAVPGDQGLVLQGQEKSFYGVVQRRFVAVMLVGRAVVRLDVTEGPDARTRLQAEHVQYLTERAVGHVREAAPLLTPATVPPDTAATPADQQARSVKPQ